MFKIGDRIERINSNYGTTYVGNIYTVRECGIDNDLTYYVKLEEDISQNKKYNADNFILVKDDNKKQTLEEMLKILENIHKKETNEKIMILERNLSYLSEDKEKAFKTVANYCKKEKEIMEDIERLKERSAQTFNAENDLKAIMEHDTVDYIEVGEEKNINVFTNYIDIYDSEGNRYKGNKYKLRFDYNSMNCKILGLDKKYCRESFWSDFDPHPHVSGINGSACWGDAGSMLSSTMNAYEIYASYIVVLNFLQQVNTEDVAGKNIRRWDCVDENDNIIENPYKQEDILCYDCEESLVDEEQYECEHCGEIFCSEHSRYLEAASGYICDRCLDNHYTYCEDCNEYVDNDDVTYVESEGRYICYDCIDNCYTGCYVCNEYVNNDNIIFIDSEERYVCCDCIDDNYTKCDICFGYHRNDEIKYCTECERNICPDCSEFKDGLCEECYDEKNTESEEA